MTPMAIPPHEHGVTRVFALDLETQEEAETFVAGDGVLRALGAGHLDTDHVTLIPVADLSELGLVGYLNHGLGLPMGQLDPLRGQLAAIQPFALLIGSRAFDGQAQHLEVIAPLHLVGTFTADDPPVVFEALPDAGARGLVPEPPPPPKSDARIGGMVATVALVVMFALVGLMVWVAGR